MLGKILFLDLNQFQHSFTFVDRKYCGRNHPKYIQALLQLLQYSNEFIQDRTSVELAQVFKTKHHHRILNNSFFFKVIVITVRLIS